MIEKLNLMDVQIEKLDSFVEGRGLDKKEDIPRIPISDNVYKSYDTTYIKCRNESLAGKLHEISGVPFMSKSVEMHDGTTREGVFPKFESHFDAQLGEEGYLKSDAKQFKEANGQLEEAIRHDPELSGKFTEEHREQITSGDTPDGMVWHHSETPGMLQLVDRALHERTAHTGGRSIWGGGTFYR